MGCMDHEEHSIVNITAAACCNVFLYTIITLRDVQQISKEYMENKKQWKDSSLVE